MAISTPVHVRAHALIFFKSRILAILLYVRAQLASQSAVKNISRKVLARVSASIYVHQNNLKYVSELVLKLATSCMSVTL